MKYVFAIIFLFLMTVRGISAANVQWDCFISGYREGYTDIEWQYEASWAYLNIVYVETTAGLNLGIGSCIMESSANWYLADYGSIVDASTALGRSSYFYATCDMPNQGGTSFYDIVFYNILVPNGGVAFLALAVLDYYSNECRYGWVALENDNGKLIKRASAIDLDGGPMYVGGGSAPSSGSPEPSSGILLLLGYAILTLRRRQ